MIQLSCAPDVVTYLHRAGRTARAGGSGSSGLRALACTRAARDTRARAVTTIVGPGERAVLDAVQAQAMSRIGDAFTGRANAQQRGRRLRLRGGQ